MKCPRCGKEFELSFRDKQLRKLVSLNARFFPVLKVACEEAKDYCNECWKERVKPIAESIAGIEK